MRLKGLIKYLISLIVAVLLLYFSFRGIDWKEFASCLKACRMEFVLLSMLVGVLSFFFRALRWRMMLLPIDPGTTVMSSFNAVNVSYIVNLALPRVGELVRCGFIARNSSVGPDGRRKASFDKVFGTVVADRMWDMLMVIVLTFLIVTLMWKRYGDYFQNGLMSGVMDHADLWWVPVIIIAAVAAAVFLLRKYRTRSRFCGKVCDVVSGVWTGFVSHLRMSGFWKFLLCTLAVWCTYWIMSASIIWAVQGMDLSFLSPEMQALAGRLSDLDMLDALFLMIAGALSSVIPVPGGFGAFHFVVAGALSAVYGVPFSLGLIFATLSHESQAITQIVCGGVSYCLETFKKRD